MNTKKVSFYIAIVFGIICTVACFGMGIFSYNWWDQIRILFPAFGGEYLKLEIVIMVTWILCIICAVLLVTAAISLTSKICGSQFPKFIILILFIDIVGLLGATICLTFLTRKSYCQTIYKSKKNEVSESTTIRFVQWLNAYTKNWPHTKARHYREHYEEEVCEVLGNKIWPWFSFVVLLPVAGLVYFIYHIYEKKQEEENLDDTPMSRTRYVQFD